MRNEQWTFGRGGRILVACSGLARTETETTHMLQFKAPATAPAPKFDNLKWETLNVDSLPEDLRKLYEEWRTASEHAKTLKARFTDECREAVIAPEGKQFVLGYLYGKLSFAFAPIKTSKAQANAISFASLMK